MKNVLIFGPAGSLFVRDFCFEVFDKGEQEIVLLSREYSVQYEKDYNACCVKQLKWPNIFSQGILNNLKPGIVSEYISCIKKLEQDIGFEKQVDVMFVHYVEPIHLLYLLPIWNRAKRKILVFWGDDILRASDIKLKIFPFFLKRATGIVFMIQKQCEYFQSKLGHKYDDKIQVLDFGNSVLSQIDAICERFSKEQCKEKFGLARDRITVHVGYNAFRGQQHLEMMQSIVDWIQAPSSKKWLDRLEFVYHVSYGKDGESNAYIGQLKQVMDEVNLRYIFIDDYIQGNDLAMFRKTCDIFLYGQKTDARSASPLEYIYAGARFICPEWLWENYELLNEEERMYYKYHDFKELSKEFEKCLIQYTDTEAISVEEKKVIKDAISWESLAPKWRSLYE